jgi:hypothetical protein
VFITRGIERAELEKLFAAFTDPLTGQGQAAADRTLSVKGFDGSAAG